MSQSLRAVLIILLLLHLFLPGCSRKNTARENLPIDTIVMVTIDTWRWDANGFMGRMNPSPTPFIDTLAEGGWFSTLACTPVPLTGPSHWSMLSGRWPWKDRVRVNGDFPVSNGLKILPEYLQDSGWITGAFVSCTVLDHRFGFDRGFDHYDDRVREGAGIGLLVMPERRGDKTIDAAITWLNTIEPQTRLFLWLHLFDPHFPYQSPEGSFGEGPRAAYLGEVRFTDSQLQHLSDILKNQGRDSDRTLWVVLSDHGEGLGDHDENTHGHLLHGSTTRISMILNGPGIPTNSHDLPVSTIDLLPTLGVLCGFEFSGTDGIDLLAGADLPDRVIPMESLMPARSFGLAAVQGLRWKEWLWERSPNDHLWNLREDPAEETDLAREHTDIVRQARSFFKPFEIPDTGPSPGSSELLQELKSLGYLTGRSKAGTGDVRSFVIEGEDLHFKILTTQMEGKLTEAERHVNRFLDLYPDSPSMWDEAGMIAVKMKKMSLAEKRFRKAIDMDPIQIKAHLNLANVLFFTNRPLDAEYEYKKVLEINPEDIYGLYNLGLLLSRHHRYEEASVFWSKLAKLYPQTDKAHEVLHTMDRWALTKQSTK